MTPADGPDRASSAARVAELEDLARRLADRILAAHEVLANLAEKKTKPSGGPAVTPETLAKACADAIGRGSSAITFVLPGYSRGNTRRLFGRQGPVGEVVADTGTDEQPESLVAFDPVNVLAFLAAKGLVKVVAKKGDAGEVER